MAISELVGKKKVEQERGEEVFAIAPKIRHNY